MLCPFCASPNAPDASACCVCAGPLSPAKPALRQKLPAAPPVMRAPMRSAPQLLGRLTLNEKTPSIIGLGMISGEESVVGLILENGALQLWNVADDTKKAFAFKRWFGRPDRACCAAFAPQHELFATGHRCGRVRLLALGRRELRSPSAHIGGVLALAFAPTQLYSGGSDGVIWATPLPAGERKFRAKSRVLIEGLGAMTTLAVSPDGSLLCVGRDDGAVQLWRFNAGDTADDDEPNVSTVQLDWTREKHAAPIESLAFSPDGATIVSRSSDESLCLWAAQTSYQLPLALGARQSRAAPAFSADSRLLAIAGEENGVDIFDIALEAMLDELPPIGENISHLMFAPAEDANLLIVAGAREVAVWKIF